MTTVSVIIPTFNRGHLLAAALDSVLNQTRQPEEIIVVDDASTDNTADIVRGYEPVTYVRLEQNRGAGAARNLGAKRATGEWLAFLDSDDTWMPEKIECQLGFLCDHPAVDLLCTGIRVTHPGKAVTCYGYPDGRPDSGWRASDFQHYAFSTPTWMIRHSAFNTMGGFDESLPNCEDLDFLLRLNSRGRIEMLGKSLVDKYNQPDSLDGNLDKLEQSYRLLLDRHQQDLRQSPAALRDIWLRLANLRLSEGDFADGRRALISAIRCSPRTLKAWFWLLLSLCGQRVFYWFRRKRADYNATSSH